MLLNNWGSFVQKVKLLKTPQLIRNKDPVLEDILSTLEEESEKLSEGKNFYDYMYIYEIN